MPIKNDDMKHSRLLFSIVFTIFMTMPDMSGAGVADIGKGWLFKLSDVPEAADPEYDDSSWRELDLPHDWAFENGFSRNGAQKDRGGYAGGGIGWYRKHIGIPDAGRDRKYYLDFDAVYMNSEVWINGQYLGKRPYGYISFSYDISRYVRKGDNVISVRVDNSLEPSARWYHGCGIYGSVCLRTENILHFTKDGIHLRTHETDSGQWDVAVSYTLEGGTGTAEAVVKKNGRRVSDKVSGDSGILHLSVREPELWSPGSPSLYELEIRLKNGKGKVCDTESIRFGFRTIGWDAEKGFFLNGKNIKLRGVCEHLEGGPVGAMWTRELLRWKLGLLKDMGCNAIRTAHNPQLPFFYDLCDEMGILVMDEIFDGWKQKAEHDYGAQAFAEWWERDLRDFIRRDRNHPCVFIYSMGNETRGDVAADLVRVCHEEDPDRMVTSGHSGSEFMDVLGVNGNSEKQTFFKDYRPDGKAFIGTETPHTWQVRGYYRTKTWYRDGYPNKWQAPFEIPDLTEKEIFGYDWTSPQNRRNVKQIFNSSYDNATVRLTARHNMAFLRDLPWYSGHFRWTGFDYLGEAGYVHGGWPFRAFMGGVIDLAGFRKDHFYLYQSQWRENDLDMVHILPHWTHPDMAPGTMIPVWVYTTGDSAELFFDGESLGIRKKGKGWNEMQCEWKVPWKPGVISVKAYRNGRETGSASVRTSGTGYDFEIVKDCDAGDTDIVTFMTTDKTGTMFPYGDNRIYIDIPEGAEVLSFENGNPVDTTCNFRSSSRRAFFGLCRAFIRNPQGKGVLTAACINGDRSLKISDTVTVSVHRISLATGKTKGGRFTVRYTTDGSEPDQGSPLYEGPFRVSANTTVKALVTDRNGMELRLEETFGDGTGLYWGTPGENVCENEGLQAEYAVLDRAAVRNTSGDNVNGAGFVQFKGKGSSITWYQENDGAPMQATLRIRYSQQLDSGATVLELQNNGEFSKKLEFTDTGSADSDWEYKEVSIPLYTGANNIKLTAVSDSAPNIDEIFIEYR